MVMPSSPSPPPTKSQQPLRNQGKGGWSHLPDLLLLSIVLRLTNLSDLLCFAAVCSSWRRFFFSFISSSSPALRRRLSSQPPLLLLPKPYYRFQSLDRPAADSIGVKPLIIPDDNLPRKPNIVISLGYSCGHLIFQLLPSEPHVRLVISDPFTGRHILPPPPPPDDFPSFYSNAVLSASPGDDNENSCFLILFTQSSVVYHRLLLGGNDHHQDKGGYTVRPLNLRYNKPFHVSSIIPFNSDADGRRVIYAVNRPTNLLLEISPNQNQRKKGGLREEEEELGIKIHVVNYVMRCGMKEFDKFYLGPQLAELDGELLLLVFLRNYYAGRRGGGRHLRWLKVYRMDFTAMRWAAKADAEDVLEKHALFVDTCGMGVRFVSEPELWGGRRNRLYVAPSPSTSTSTWREFTLEKGGLVMPAEYPSLPLIQPESTLPRWPAPIWIHLTDSQTIQ